MRFTRWSLIICSLDKLNPKENAVIDHSKKVKVLYITNGVNGSGGLERVLSTKASYFANTLDYSVHILCLNQSDPRLFYDFSNKIFFHYVKASGGAVAYLKMYITSIQKVVDEVNPSVICVCDDGLKGVLLPIWLKIKNNIPLVYERHASIFLERSLIKRVLMRIGPYLYDRFVVLTKSNLREWYGSNLQVIPNPLSFQNIKSAMLENKTIICVGSMSQNKGYDLLIDAWSKISHLHPDWSVEVYGKRDDSLYSLYQQKMKELKVTPPVLFFPPEANIELKYQNASIFVLPSRSEGFGMVLIEAMAFGVPCVAFDCPSGPRDIISNKKDGYLVANGDVNELAEKINLLINDASLRKKMGEQAIKSVQYYSIDQVSKKWQDLFNALIEKKP